MRGQAYRTMGFLSALGSKKKSDRRNKQHWQTANCEPKATSIERRRQRENNTQKAALMATGSGRGARRRAKQEEACGSKRYYDYDYVYYVVIRLSAIFTSFFPLFLLLKFASSFSCRHSAPPATCLTCAICCYEPASSGVVNSTLLVRRHFRLALAYDT